MFGFKAALPASVGTSVDEDAEADGGGVGVLNELLAVPPAVGVTFPPSSSSLCLLLLPVPVNEVGVYDVVCSLSC